MKKRTKIILGTVAAAVTLAAGGYWAYKTFVPQETPIDEQATVATNYYQAINKDWLKETKIPADQPSNGAFHELHEEVEKKLKDDVKKLAAGQEKTDVEGMDDFVSYYQLAADQKARDKEGLAPLKPYLQEIENLSSIEDLASKAADWQQRGLVLPFGFEIGVNLEETSQKQVWLTSPGLLLPDASYYQDQSSRNQLMAPVETAATKALTMLGYSDKDSQHIVKEALAFDEELAKYAQTSEEAAEIKNQFHPKTASEIDSYSDQIQLSAIIRDYLGQDVSQVNVLNPKYFEHFSQLVNDKNLPKIKSWMLLRQSMAASKLLTEDYRLVFAEIDKSWSGSKEASSREDAVFQQASAVFSDSLSLYYGRKYFGQEAKDEVTQMVDEIKAVYRERLQKNDWLSEATKQEAVKKLDSLALYIGYPDKVREETKLLKVDKKASFFANSLALAQIKSDYAREHFSEPVDKTEWEIPSYDINAYYSPNNNSINFPAGILQAPFYDAKQSMEQNYGGIGMVIGHEITHAFDSNGADFDEQGNMKNWWTEADKKAFESKTQAFINQWDGLEIYGGKVNGKLTVTENVADAGGLSATLQVVQTKNPQADLKAYFENYANIWRNKASLQFNQLMLTVDVHAPAELRVNQQLKNVDAFYQAYPEIKEGYPMYLAPDERISLW